MLGLKRRSKQSEAGVTLMEIILVLAIGAAILLLSLQQYFSFKRDSDIQIVKSNVNAIFQAMSAYYRINCYGSSNKDGSINVAGTLRSAPGQNLVLNISTDLIKPQILSQASVVVSPIVDDVGAIGGATLGYVAQYNRVNPDPQRQICINGTGITPVPGVPTPNPTCNQFVNTGAIMIWKGQVAAKLKDATNAQVYLNVLGGDCLSSPGAGGIINPCSRNTPGDYIVWERLPSSVNENAPSPFRTTLPTVSQFTQMYKTETITNLTDGFRTGTQYYVCGN